MPFDWREYLELARLLLAQAGSGCTAESAHRTAVSRAYYAAFNHALKYATDFLGFVPRARPEDRTLDHGRLRAHLERRRRFRVAARLGHLHTWRNECDYVDDLPGVDLPARATQAVTAADYVFNSLMPPARGP